MSKTYVLQSTEMHCGYERYMTSNYWDLFIGSDARGMMIGKVGDFYRLTNIMFDQTMLASLRSKTVTSIKLTLTFDLAATIYGSSDTKWPIGYKYNNVATTTSSGNAWTRSNADSTSPSTDVVGYIRSSGSQYSIAAGESITLDLTGTRVPVYGYVLGTYYGSGYEYHIKSYATLTVVTNETDYSFKLSYNANGGSGAPSAQTGTGTVVGTPSHTFTIPNTTPTRSGYFFDGWKVSGGTTLYQPGGQITVTANTTLYAQWSPASSIISSVTSPVPITGVSSTGTLTVNITRYNSSYTHDVTITIGSRSTTLTGQGTTVTYTIPVSWLDQMPTTTSIIGTVEVVTKNGSTTIGVAASTTFTATVPSDVKPDVTLTYDDVNTNYQLNQWNVLVSGYSKIKLIVSATAGSGSEIESITFSGDGVSQSGTRDNVTSALLVTTGTRTWKAVVVDKRNRKTEKTVTVEVYPYANPVIDSFEAFRSDSNGVESLEAGTYLTSTANYSISSVGGLNTVSVSKISYKVSTASSYTVGVASATSGQSYTFGGGNINLLNVYDLEFEIRDAVGNTTKRNARVNSIVGIAFGLNNDRARFGGPVQKAGLQVDWDAEFGGAVDILNRRAVASLSSAGWYRVCTYNSGAVGSVTGGHGTMVRFDIQKHTSSENHSITLRLATSSGAIWCDESSNSNTQLIDKIRYSYNTTTYLGYVDIHYTGSVARGVNVDFDVHESGNNDSNLLQYLQMWKSNNLADVADAPIGETVISEHTFAKTCFGFGYQGYAKIVSTDFNDIKRGGIYYLDDTTMTNGPSNYKWAYLLVMSNPGTVQVVQTVYYTTADGQVFSSRQFAGSTPAWGTWKHSRQNAYGDVSNTGNYKSAAPDAISLATATWKSAASTTLAVGRYQISVNARFASNATGVRKLVVNKTADSSSSDIGIICNDCRQAVSGDYTYCSVSFPLNVTSSTTIYANVYQNSGSSLSTFGRIYVSQIV